MRIFIFGAGYSARAFARHAAGTAAFIGGTTRTVDRTALIEQSGVTSFLFDGLAPPSPDIERALAATTHLVISAAPDEAGCPVLAQAQAAIANMPALEWIGYLSTIGVYGDHDGAWVDEDSECRPSQRRTIARVGAEGEWTALGARVGRPVAILRLAGIYGPGRNGLVNVANGTARRVIRPGQIFNRIHVDDIAGAILFLAESRTGGIFNVSDDMPAPPQAVVEHAAGLMGVEPPPEIPFEEAGLSPMARSFYGNLKRVSNARIKVAGYRFAYPDYRSGLDAMWTSGHWQEEI